jgi:hypothetical protein
MSARRAAAVLALLAVAAAAWFSCSSYEAGDAPPPAQPPAAKPSPAEESAPPPRTVPRRRTGEAAPGAEAEEPTGNVIRGRTVLRDGSPAAGARVRTWSVKRLGRGDDAELGAERVTGDDGSFTIGGAEIGDQVVVYAVLAGHHTAFAPPPVTIESPVTDVTIRFGEGGVLTGRVVGPWGKPAGGVEVRLRPTDRLSHTRVSGDWRVWAEPGIWDFYAAATTTDADGLYRFDGVPLPRNGAPQTRVAVATVAGKDWASEDVAFETDGQEIERDIVLGEKPWTDTPLPEPPKPVARRVAGRVLDAGDKPVAGATVTYIENGGPGNVTWFGRTSNDGGGFEFDWRMVKSTHHLEVRVAAEGFRTFRGAPPDDGEMTVRLERTDHAPLPRRICGTLRTSDDKPLTGPVEITAVDEMYRVHRLWTWADADGSFTLEGIAPGEWQVFLSWNDPWQTATVLEEWDAVVKVVSRRRVAEFAPEPWTEEKAKQRDKLREEVEQLIDRRDAEAKEGESTDKTDAKIEQAVQALHSLDAPSRASLPVREVVVTGLPKDAGCVVVATDGSREWRSEAKDGVARFAGLSVEKWTLTLVRPGLSDLTQETEVAAGDGAQTIPGTGFR